MNTTIMSRLLRVVVLTLFLGAFTNVSAQVWTLSPSLNNVVPKSGTNTDITATPASPSTYSGNELYTWYRNGIELVTAYTPVYSTDIPGSYHAKIVDGTKVDVTDPVIITALAPVPNYTYSGFQQVAALGTPSSPTYVLINGDVTFEGCAGGSSSNIKFLNCVFLFNGNYKIKFNEYDCMGNQQTVWLEDCQFYGLNGGEWSGIEIEGVSSYSSQFVDIKDCIIQDAKVGTYLNGDRNFSVSTTEYGRNMAHIYLQNADDNTFTKSISTSNFGNCNVVSYSPTGFPSLGLHYGIYMDVCQGVTIEEDHFVDVSSETFIGTDVYSIYGYAANYNYIIGCHFDGDVTYAIKLENSTSDQISSNFVNLSPVPVQYTAGSGSNNWIEPNVHEAALHISEGYDNLINNNYFYNTTYGIENYDAIFGSGTDIEYNTIDACDYGIVLASHENPLTSSYPYANIYNAVQLVRMNCNKIQNSNHIGIIGVGLLVDQGSVLISGSPPTRGVDAGNNFSGNTDADIFWYDPSGASGGVALNYYFNDNDPSIITAEQGSLRYSTPDYQLPSTITLDGSTTGLNGEIFFDNSGQLGSCWGTWKKGNTTDVAVIDEVKEGYSIYPNPFNGSLTINLSNGTAEKYTVVITDITGKTVGEYNSGSASELTIKTNEFIAGIYFVRVYDNNRTLLHTQKLVKAQ